MQSSALSAVSMTWAIGPVSQSPMLTPAQRQAWVSFCANLVRDAVSPPLPGAAASAGLSAMGVVSQA